MTLSARNWAWDQAVTRPDGRRMPGAEHVLLCLAERENAAYGYAWPTQDELAERTGYSLRGIRNFITALEGAGLIRVVLKRVRGQWANARYYLAVPEEYRRADAEWMRTAEKRPAAPRADGEPVDNSMADGAPAAPGAGDHRHLVPSPAAPGADYKSHTSHQDQSPCNTAERGDDRPMTDAQRQNVVDAITAVAGGTDAIDVLAYLPQELTYLDGLRPDTRRKRISAWAGLRSRAQLPGGDDLVDDDRLHDLLAAHGYVWRGDDTDPWATYREETTV